MTSTIHIVDDDASFRRAVGRLMAASGYQVVFYESGEEILTRVPGPERGCILLDLQMPGLSGSELQDRLRVAAPLLPIVFLTGHGDIRATVRAIKAGAEDFLEKTASSDGLLQAIERALVQFDKRRLEHDHFEALQKLLTSLTPRESEVFNLMVRGKLNKQIAFALGASERTIKAHRHRVMEKLGVHSLAEAVSIAERSGMLVPPVPQS